MTITTERLILRRWNESDAEELYKYASDPDIGYPAGWPAHLNVEDSREVIVRFLSAPETYAVCLKENGLPIGSIGLKTGTDTDLTDRCDECELGYWIGKPFWGMGMIPEAARALLFHAFHELEMTTVWCGYYDGNEKSRRVQEKLGFVFHHTTESVDVPLLGEKRTGHVNFMTRRLYDEKYR